jgi:phosphoribosylaminoimidazole carboxylase (NCAIR synthetase)
VKLHLYCKNEPRPGRKMGHLTVTSDVTSAAASKALELRDRLDPG